ncbi:glutamine dumper [Thalictrum thalictroides]|uniref:Glutamine dumper n=1 Tax=Thalictrum thalictroides TaxID=46969 RepID=A0A7J6V6W1_THATH|nr:glutamine dumper [Thalictrum thalictroides]
MWPASSHSANAHYHKPNSPIPYLFGGLAAMLGLIAISLIFLVCMQRKSSTGSAELDDIEMAPKLSLPPPEMEPKIVVIMAGDYMPTFLAKPVSTIQHEEQEV